MINNLKEKLEKINNKYDTDVDVISLKALCQIPENDQINIAIKATLDRLLEKYPDDEEILNLLPKKEKISLEKLIEILEEKYLNNVDVITMKALSALPNGENKENAVKQCLERLLEKYLDDEDIKEYLDVKEIVIKEPKKDMVLVEGGTFIPSFFNEKRTTFDLYVAKYDVTNDEWDELMDKNPSKVMGDRKPVNNIKRIDAFKYCNELSKKYGFKPVYKIENDKLVKIIYKDGKEEYPNLADFRKTEGYRLPTEIEWEWFAWGGKIAQKKEKFDKKLLRKERIERKKENLKKENEARAKRTAFENSLSDIFSDLGTSLSTGLGIEETYYEEFAWYGWYETIHDVGLKKPNELGLYDVIGNVNQHIYDTALDGYIDEIKLHIYDENAYGRLRGGNCKIKGDKNEDLFEDRSCINYIYYGNEYLENTGFRVVRTAKTIK